MKIYEKAAAKLLIKQISELPIMQIKFALNAIYEANGLFVDDDEIDYVAHKIKNTPDKVSECLQEIILKGSKTNV